MKKYKLIKLQEIVDYEGWDLIRVITKSENASDVTTAVIMYEDKPIQEEPYLSKATTQKLIKILINNLQKDIDSSNYDYYSQEGHILDKIQQLLNIIKVMNGEIPFANWYLEDLLENEEIK